MIFKYYDIWQETGNIKPFYDLMLKLSQIECRKQGFPYDKEAISIAVAGDIFIGIATGKIARQDLLTKIHTKTRSICFSDYKHPIYSRTTFIPLENFDFIQDSIIPMGSEVVSKRWRTDEYIDEIKKYAETHTTKECAERFGYTYEAMRTIKNKYKIKTKLELRHFESRYAEAVAWCNEKTRSLGEIMEKFNVSKSTAFLFAKKNKIKVRVESVCDEYEEQIRQMRSANASWTYISRKINIPLSTLYHYVKRKNIN